MPGSEQPQDPGNRTADGLPIRIRQASVARTLPEGIDDTFEVPPVTASRTPEQMRNMLASFQNGMNQGRAVASAGNVDEPSVGTGSTNGINGAVHASERSANGGSHRAADGGAAPTGGTQQQSAANEGGSPMARGGGNDDN